MKLRFFQTPFGVVSTAVIALSAGLTALPAPRPPISPFADFAASNDASSAGGFQDQSAVSIAKRFDLSKIPLPPPPTEPPADPAAGLRQFSYLGSARSGDQLRALFERNGMVHSVQLGDVLEEFTLIDVTFSKAVFGKDDLDVELPIDAR